MENRWILIYDDYEGIEKKAVNFLYGEISGYLSYVLPVRSAHSVTSEELASSNLIVIGKADGNAVLKKSKTVLNVPQISEGYSLFVGESVFSHTNQMIVIAGYDAAGVFYGCMDFCNKYLGDILYRKKNIWTDSTYEEPFSKKLNPWQSSISPAIKRRAIWTWGHVIYDYRKFLENMARLRLNEIVIWNDVAPLNANDVVEYAHSLNIKVIWGFAWGWDTKNKNVLEKYDQNALLQLKQNVLEIYKTQYADTLADGIYFQSFTELDDESVNGKCIAREVTELVNDIAGSLLRLYPDLHIQFGLHATSVKNKLEYIKNVDKRIYIVWEDCGSFPFDYYADRVEDFDETLEFTEKILTLRGKDEKWGAVLKGMLKLDWRKFQHFSAPYLLGERTERFIKERQTKKDRIWKLQQASWLKNANYIRRILSSVEKYGNENSVVQALVEDAMLENEIALPVALFAELLWNPEKDSLELIEQVAKYPCVHFSNI